MSQIDEKSSSASSAREGEASQPDGNKGPFDCRNNTRIWLGFENHVINPVLEAQFPGLPPWDSASKLSPGSDSGRHNPAQE